MAARQLTSGKGEPVVSRGRNTGGRTKSPREGAARGDEDGAKPSPSIRPTREDAAVLQLSASPFSVGRVEWALVVR